MVELNPVQYGNWPFRIVAGNPSCVWRPMVIEPANQRVQVFTEKNELRGSGFTERPIR